MCEFGIKIEVKMHTSASVGCCHIKFVSPRYHEWIAQNTVDSSDVAYDRDGTETPALFTEENASALFGYRIFDQSHFNQHPIGSGSKTNEVFST